jgi:hypothetical protein
MMNPSAKLGKNLSGLRSITLMNPIQISKGFKDAGGKELKIRVEYGLAENINFGQLYLLKYLKV